jgi:hypothetical protein
MNKPLPNPIAEQDANDIAEVWLLKGKDSAAEQFNVVCVKRRLKRYESVILLNRTLQILIEKGICIGSTTLA